MLKKFAFFVLILSFLNADIIISADALPESIKHFIASNFNAQIGLVQQDSDEYEIYLSDGTELEFDIMGDYKEIKSELAPLSLSILPANIASIVQSQFPGAFLQKIKRKFSYYELEFSNSLEVKIDSNGTILSQKFD